MVITNKLYYKFFVLDKVVNSGQVDAKQISEVFWKLSEVSQHLLCPGQWIHLLLSEKIRVKTEEYFVALGDNINTLLILLISRTLIFVIIYFIFRIQPTVHFESRTNFR